MKRVYSSVHHIIRMPLPLLIVLALMLSVFIPSYSSAQSKEKDKPERKVVKKVKLNPTPDAEVILPDFTATIYDDGTRSVESTITSTPDVVPPSFEFEVDPEKGTYKTKKIKPAEGNVDDQSGQIGTLAVPGTYVWKILVEGKDPVFIIVNRTTNRLEWRVNSNGSMTWLSYIDSCYARNPTPVFETHWYVTSCTTDAPFNVSGTSVPQIRNIAEGRYINWDWGDPNLSTTARSQITLTAFNDGTFSNNWVYEDAGEDAGLLRGTVTTCKCY